MVYQITNNKNHPYEEEKKKKLEDLSNLFVGIAMCVAGIIMLILTYISNEEEKGNVIPGLCIALLGVIANNYFWIKYYRLNLKEPNQIIKVQSRLYGVKSFVDVCVTISLVSILILPNSNVSYYLDMVGSTIGSIYLIFSVLKTIYEKIKVHLIKKNNN